MRKMKRRDREVTDLKEILYILDKCETLHLGLVDEGKPYIVPLNYGYFFDEEEKLHFILHGALDGRKLDVIRKNSVCCAQMECDSVVFEGGPLPCQYGTSYYSLEGFGNIYEVTDVEEKIKDMTIMMQHIAGKEFQFNEKLVKIVSVFDVVCDEYTAKHRDFPAALRGEN